MKPEDRGRYQDIALAVAKVACLYSNASKEAANSSLHSEAASSSPMYAPHSPSLRGKGVMPSAAPCGSPRAAVGCSTSTKKALKLLKSGGGAKEGSIRAAGTRGEALSPQVLLQVVSYFALVLMVFIQWMLDSILIPFLSIYVSVSCLDLCSMLVGEPQVSIPAVIACMSRAL